MRILRAILIILLCADIANAAAAKFSGAVTIRGRVTARPSPSTVATFGTPTIVEDSAAIAASNIVHWTDMTLGVEKVGSAYTFWGSNASGAGHVGKAVGTLADPFATSTAAIVCSNISGIGYYSVGPVYRVDANTLFWFAYTERYPSTTCGVDCFYSSIAVAKSTDNGATCVNLGFVIEPTADLTAFATLDPASFWITGTGPYIIKNVSGVPYFYIYFGDMATAGRTNLAKARATVSSVLAAVAANTAPVFTKYDANNGGWTQPGINGSSSEIGDSQYSLLPDVKYNAYTNRYVLVSMCGSLSGCNTNFSVMYSTDEGETFSGRVFPGFSNDCVVYPTLIGTGSNPTVLGQSDWIYYRRDDHCIKGGIFTNLRLMRVSINF